MKKILILFVVLLLIQIQSKSQGMQDGNIWLVSINVFKYQNHSLINDLNYSVMPAYQLSQLFETRQLTKFSPTTITNNRATRNGIINELQSNFIDNAELSNNDMIIFYFSGHGKKMGKYTGLCPYDYSGDLRDLITDVDIMKIMEKSKAKHKICFIEACRNSSEEEIVTQDITDPKFLEELNQERSKFKGGMAYMTSGSDGQLTTGLESRGGYFSYYLLEGLKGNADSNRDGFVTIREIYTYIYNNVLVDTKNEQTPKINDKKYYDENIPIMIVPKMEPVKVLTEPCEVNKVGDVCIYNNSENTFLYIVAGDKVVEIRRGQQECFYDVPAGIFRFKARTDRPGGGSYCLGCYNVDLEVRVEACKSVTKRIN